MEVTRKNFKSQLSTIAESIENASFISIDTEFTGLTSGLPGHGTNALDSPADRYNKLRSNAMDFLIVQFGMCTFQYLPAEKKHKVQAYNFYVFPHTTSRHVPDIRFLCQSSSIDFLVSNGFDFNKLFKEGIPYLSPAAEQKLRETIVSKHKVSDAFCSPPFTSPTGVLDSSIAKGPVIIPKENESFINDICQSIEDFLDTNSLEMDLDPCNAFLRKITYQTLKTKYKTGIHLETKTKENKQRYIVVSKIASEEQALQKEADKYTAELEELEDAVGFSKVIRMISQSGKLVIGHNMLLDVMHTLRHFCSPLPHSYEEFKSLSSCVFPRLCDTKLMASIQPFRDIIFNSTLGDMHTILQSKPFRKPAIVIPEDFPQYNTCNERLHEAGYDAYITGLCFIGLANYLGTFQTPDKLYIAPSSPILEPFVNKVYVYKMLDIPYMNLAGSDLCPNRDHVFHVTFPKEWRYQDLLNTFSAISLVQIYWVKETSAFVALPKKNIPSSTVIQSAHVKNSCASVTTYKDYIHHKNATNTSQENLLKRKQAFSGKRQLNAKASPFRPKRSITPIPEEQENGEESGDQVDKASPGDQTITAPPGSGEASLMPPGKDFGEPFLKKRKLTNQNADNASALAKNNVSEEVNNKNDNEVNNKNDNEVNNKVDNKVNIEANKEVKDQDIAGPLYEDIGEPINTEKDQKTETEHGLKSSKLFEEPAKW